VFRNYPELPEDLAYHSFLELPAILFLLSLLLLPEHRAFLFFL
jgi:hypothetical protein